MLVVPTNKATKFGLLNAGEVFTLCGEFYMKFTTSKPKTCDLNAVNIVNGCAYRFGEEVIVFRTSGAWVEHYGEALTFTA